ncbi:hypothetical protein QQP08_008942 [Theobroma cacao]|nr:hypothetical protein QQP08_008942 [Theobroma cacao]
MALQENNLLDNRLPLLKLRALQARFKAKGVLRSKQEEAAVEVEWLATAMTLAAAAMACDICAQVVLVLTQAWSKYTQSSHMAQRSKTRLLFYCKFIPTSSMSSARLSLLSYQTEHLKNPAFFNSYSSCFQDICQGPSMVVVSSSSL